MTSNRTARLLWGTTLALSVFGLAACERGGEGPSSGGFENPEVVTPAEVPPSAGATDTTAAAPPDAGP